MCKVAVCTRHIFATNLPPTIKHFGVVGSSITPLLQRLVESTMSGPRGSTSSLSEDDGDDQRRGMSRVEAVPVKGALRDEKIAPSPQLARSPLHLQKRRRVTRACDECRRKKIKCDGKQPCTHCTVYSYGQYWIKDAEVRSAGTNGYQIADTPPQNALMISRQIEDVTQPRNILRP